MIIVVLNALTDYSVKMCVRSSKLSTRHGGNVKHGMHAKKRTQSRKAGKELKSRNAGNGMTVGKTNKIWGSQLGKYQN